MKILYYGMKILYYVGFFLIVVNAGDLITKLIFADEFNLYLIHDNLGFIMFGFFEMLYARSKIRSDEFELDVYYLICAIEDECSVDGYRKIQERARAIKLISTIDPDTFYKEHIEKEKKHE